MEKEIVLLFYMPVGVFVLSSCCTIATGVVYYYTKHTILPMVLLYGITLTIISFLHVYPIYGIIHTEYWAALLFAGMIISYIQLSMYNKKARYQKKSAVIYIIIKSVCIYIAVCGIYAIDNTFMIIVIDCLCSLSLLIMTPAAKVMERPMRQKAVMQLLMVMSMVYLWIAVSDKHSMHSSICIVLLLIAAHGAVTARMLVQACTGYTSYCMCRRDGKDYDICREKNKVVEFIKEHIHEYYRTPLDKYTIAMHCEKHPDYIVKIFKKSEGVTINEYIKDIRLQKALDMVSQDNRKIIEIAFSVGYDNLATFYRHFAKKYNKTPQYIRKFGNYESCHQEIHDS